MNYASSGQRSWVVRFSCFILWLFFAILLAARPAAASRDQQIAFDGNLAEGQTVSNTIRIVGFAVTPGSAGYVEVALGPQNLGRAAYPLPRSDVPNSGFIMEIDTLNFMNGAHSVTVNSYTEAGALVSSARRTLIFKNILALGRIETPSFRDPVSGEAVFTGWALADGGFKRLELHINGLLVGLADWGFARSDVLGLYPEYGIAASGFSASVNLGQLGLARGYQRVTVIGVDGTDTRRNVADSEFFYTEGRVGQGLLEEPVQGAVIDATRNIRVAGWTGGDARAVRVDVYINDRWAGTTTNVNRIRRDVTSDFSDIRNVGGFDFEVPAALLGQGRQRITVVVTDSLGRRANIDSLTGPIHFDVGRSLRVFGAHLRPKNNYAAAIAQYASEVGEEGVDIVMYFQPWRNSSGSCVTFNEYPFLPNAVRSAGAQVMVSWEPLQDGAGSEQPSFSHASILSGVHDRCIRAYARQIKNFGDSVLIRMAHEMNGNSNNWTGIANGNDPQGYINMYRKVVDMFRQEGATNARFVWSPDHASPPEVPAPANELKNYFPGTGYVDYIGVSGYNWGNDPLRGGGWVSGEQIFGNFLDMTLREFPGKPVLITEIGSVPGYANFNRDDWYRETFEYLSSREDLKGVVWFNDFAFANTQEADFRFTNTPGLPGVNADETATMRELIPVYLNATGGGDTQVTVSEFYAPSLNHYFRTANAQETSLLKSSAELGWQYTGHDFNAYARNGHPESAKQVCRFYGSMDPGPNSHFYTAEEGECSNLRALQAVTPESEPRWNFEEISFSIEVPTGGACLSSAPVPVYRVYNNRAAENDSNHRYTTDLVVYQQMLDQGWQGEGITMCAPLPPN